MNNSTLIIVRGLPGSGKSYLADRLSQKFTDTEVVLLDPDATDYQSLDYARHVQQQLRDGVAAPLHAYRFLRSQAYDGIAAGKTIIWNQPFTNLEIFNKMVTNLRAQADLHKTKLIILVVEVVIDPDVAKQRVKQRIISGGHGPSDATFDRFTTDYKSFVDAGFNTVTIPGNDDIDQSVMAVLSSLRTTLAEQTTSLA